MGLLFSHQPQMRVDGSVVQELMGLRLASFHPLLGCRRGRGMRMEKYPEDAEGKKAQGRRQGVPTTIVWFFD